MRSQLLGVQGTALAIVLVMAFWVRLPARAELLLDDPLQGSTTGARSGGQFVTGGWQVTGQYDCIYWHLPRTVPQGAVEFDVKGLNPNECRAGMEDKTELFHMYDYTWYNSDVQYGDPGYRNNPYKHFIRKTGCLGSYNNTIDALEIVWSCNGDWYEADSPVLSWNPSNTYHFRVQWGPDGSGNSVLKIYRDGSLVFSRGVVGSYSPAGHSVRIAASPRRAADAGAPIGAIFSSFRAWDTSGALAAPSIAKPSAGETVRPRVVFVQWTGDPHIKYQVRVNTANDPDTGIFWDSGEVSSARDWAWTGTLNDSTTYYAFVRIGNASGWSPWSAGRSFTVNTSYNPGTPNRVRVQGKSLADNDGPVLGLGATYMPAMWMCKNDRTNYRSDLSFLSQKGFNYIRVLSEVPGACPSCYWYNRSINPVGYTCQHGVAASAWPDYDHQFRDTIDIAYDECGIRTEVTIFGGAGESMPSKSTRQAHLDKILSLIAGREHKIVQIEVANEAWQTGFPDPQGSADLREFGQYLAARTEVPISLTSPWDTTVAGLLGLYAGSAADIATCHFSRDLGTSEGDWLPVRDCWEEGDVAGLMPVSSNEPIGPGSSVNTEDHPIRLASAACFAWTANLPMYVFHSRAGVRRDQTFQSMAGINEMVYLRQILPPDLASWVRNDGKESSAPFSVYCNGQENKYWTDVPGATSGCHRNIGGIKGGEFVCYPQGILSGGVELKARRPMTFKYYDPLTGAQVGELTKNAGDRFTLTQGSGAYIIKGRFLDFGSYPGTLRVKEATSPITIDGNPADWNLSEFTTVSRAGRGETGDVALTGYDGGTLYYAGYFTDGALPTSPSDHTAKVYSRYDSTYQYFLVRCDDSDIRYPNGNLNGNGGWSGSAASQIAVENELVKVSGGAGAVDAIQGVSCGSLVGNQVAVWAKIKKGAGSTIFWNLTIDDSSGKNFGRWFGNGMLARGRIGSGSQQTASQGLSGGWDCLFMKIDFAANTTQFFFNGASLGSYSHTETGAGDALGRIRFERLDSGGASGQYVYFDDVQVAVPDTTAPSPSVGAPSASITRTGPVSYAVTFGEPVYGFSSSSDIQLDATGSAAAASVGVAGSGSGPYTVTLSTISGVGTLGITVKAGACTDAAGNANAASAPSATFIVIAFDGSIASAKGLSNGSTVELGNKVLYLKWPVFGYIEEQNRTCGIRLEGNLSGSEGDLVCLRGTVQTTAGGEKYVLVSAMSPCDTFAPKPARLQQPWDQAAFDGRPLRSDVGEGEARLGWFGLLLHH